MGYMSFFHGSYFHPTYFHETNFHETFFHWSFFHSDIFLLRQNSTLAKFPRVKFPPDIFPLHIFPPRQISTLTNFYQTNFHRDIFPWTQISTPETDFHSLDKFPLIFHFTKFMQSLIQSLCIGEGRTQYGNPLIFPLIIGNYFYPLNFIS